MALESLLLSRDVDVVRILRPTLEKLAIEVEVCQEAAKAGEILLAEKFDAVIVDCDDLPGAVELLQSLRSTATNKNTVTFALLNGRKTSTQQAFGMGVNFVLQKPITTLNASRCFNAALNFMERERRRYYRQPVEMPVVVVLDDKEVKATSTNISEGGIALFSRQALPKHGNVHVRFSLPDSTLSLEIESVVAWADLKGHAGLRFVNVPESTQQSLEKWLNQEMEKPLPGPIDNLPGVIQ
jgi:DNA-binding response OmpR family regulator